MKVAFINTVIGYGSVGKITELLAKNEKIQSKAFYGRKEYKGSVDSFKFNNLMGNSIHAIKTFFFDSHCFENKKETELLIKELIEFSPDIVHLHNLHGYYLNIEILFKGLKSLNIPVVMTLHDCWTFTGHCPHFDSINCQQWKTHCEKCRLYSDYPFSFNKYNVYKNYDRKRVVFNSLKDLTIITPSLWLKHQVESSFLRNYKCIVINNGIQLDIFNTSYPRKQSDKIRLLAVSNVWTKTKGLDDLVELAKLLPNKYQLTVIGLTKRQIKLFPDNISCIERTADAQELAKYYCNSDVFINFTYQDTFPTVNIESLACGTPIITYNTGGSVELIEDTTGIVIDKGDYLSVLDILESDALYKLDREKCALSAKKYSLKNMVNNYISLYESLMNKKNG